MLTEKDAVVVETTDKVMATDTPVADEANDIATAVTPNDDTTAVTPDDAKDESVTLPKPAKPKKRQLDPELARMVSWFAACGRCSYFFAGYKVVAGEEAWQENMPQHGKRWLTMPWNREMAHLVHKSYGNQVDTGCYHYEGCCAECRRHFVFQSAEEVDGQATFRIELKTHSRM